MFDTIVIGVDGRPGGLDALRLARRLATPSSTLIAACVARDEDAVASSQAVIADAIAERPDIRGEVVVSGSVAHGLHHTAATAGADLLVVGSSHRGVIGRPALGDDARRTVRDAPCAVAIAPDGYRHRHAPLATIGVGLGDGTERAATLALGRQLAADERATLRALHVVQIATWVTPPNVFAGINYDAALREWEDRLGALEDVAGTVVLGTRVGELAKFADALDLLVLGSCERSRAGRVLFGSTAEALAGRITVPLLVAPRSARDASGAEAADAA